MNLQWKPSETASTIPTREPSETASTISTREPSENLKSVKTSITPRSKTEDIKSSDITGQSATIQNTVKLILGNTNRQTYTPNTTKHTSNKDTQDGKSKIIGSTVGTIAALSGLVAIASFLLRKCKKNSVVVHNVSITIYEISYILICSLCIRVFDGRGS
jgi:hypothetical protein